MRSVDDHLAACLALVAVPAARPLGLDDLLDAVLAEDVVSRVDLPPFDNSAMDGFAVRHADVTSAGEQAPAVLPLAQDLPAGAAGTEPLEAGSVARIMTGAPMPPGADSVVPVEWTDSVGWHETSAGPGGGTVTIRRSPWLGQFVRRAGEDVRRGDLVLAAGTRLSPRHVALLAAIGRREVEAVPRPRVAVVSTGSELAEPGTLLGPGQVYESNAYGLVAACRELGAEARRVGVVVDDAAALVRELAGLAGSVDLVLTSGGVSAGAFEPVKQAFSGGASGGGASGGGASGGSAGPGLVEFVKVAMQPGMPQGLGTLVAPDGGRTAIVTLPGNPVSSLLSFEVFVRPMIRKLRGEDEQTWSRPVVEAAATEGWTSPPGKRQFVRGVLNGPPGSHTVTPLGRSGSHLAAALARATCLIVVPEEATEVKPGDTLRCMALDRLTR